MLSVVVHVCMKVVHGIRAFIRSEFYSSVYEGIRVFFFRSVAVKSIECFEKLLIWLHFVTYDRFILTIQVWVIIRCLVSTLRHDDLGAVLIQILLV